MAARRKPKLAVWKFASCDGCQLSLLDCEDEILAVGAAVEIAYFPEATSTRIAGPYDLVLVEGSITTPADAERIRAVRAQARWLVVEDLVDRPPRERQRAVQPGQRAAAEVGPGDAVDQARAEPLDQRPAVL